MGLGNPIGIVLFGLVGILLGLALAFVITIVLERFDVIPREHHGRWMLLIAPLAVIVVSVVGYEVS